MKKKKNRVITISVFVLLAIVAAAIYMMNSNKGPVFPFVETVTLEKIDLQNSVSVTGTVQSTNVKKIYAKLNYQITELNVSVGDRVGEGDILCKLDSSSLEASIAQQTASLSKTQQSASLKITSAEKSLADARQDLENNLNTQILQAKSSVKDAEGRLESASIELLNLKLEKNDMQDKGIDLEDMSDLDANSRSRQVTYENAKVSLQNAKDNLKAVEEAAKKKLEDYEASVIEARSAANVSDQLIGIEKLKSDLEDCTVPAPVSGVITAVYVNEGAPANGLMFVIEDTDSLKIKTKIKEFDIASVKQGDPVEIKSDATGDNIYDGALSKIAPTSVKNQQGDSDISSDVEFEAEVAVKSSGTDLRVGMKTRMNIIYKEKKQVFAVPYDAVTQNENGVDIIYIAKKDEAGAIFATPVIVETGMENDFSIEISSADISDGDEVITNIEGIIPGIQVQLQGDLSAAGGSAQVRNGAPRGGAMVAIG